MDADAGMHAAPPEGEEMEMSFFDHLEELRWRIIRSLLAVVVCAIGLWIWIEPVVEHVLLAPARNQNITLINLRPFGQVILFMQVAFFGGIMLAMPYIFYQIWKFIAPGLYKKEKRYVAGIVIFTTLCFASGVTFAYLFILPAAFQFFASFGTPQIQNTISIEEYLNFLLNLMLGAGLVFELPMVSFFLSRMGLVTPKLMRRYWRHAIVAIFVFSAILTPGTDPVSQVFLAIPLVLLYELSILISRWSQKKRVSDD